MAKSHSWSNQFQSIFYFFWWRKIYEIHSNLRIVDSWSNFLHIFFLGGKSGESVPWDVFFRGPLPGVFPGGRGGRVSGGGTGSAAAAVAMSLYRPGYGTMARGSGMILKIVEV
jgi:hypothetical protein